MALTLAYRPRTFADVVGQDHIVTTLENAVKRDRVSHAYLFSGTRGTGKTSIARILAKEILTKNVADATLKSQIVKGVEEGSLVDLIEIDAASTRGIDDIRELIEKIQFSPVVAGAKVYIIDEVHMLTKEAFNALLKTLEEPPSYAYFILATTEAHKIPETIHSRCQRFPFRRVKDEDIVLRLQYIVDQERITIDRAALRLIAMHATGSFRDAISLLDQLRSLEKITVEDVRLRTGESGEALLLEVFDLLEKRDTERIPDIVERIEEEGVPVDRVLRQLLTLLRERLHEAIEKKEDTRPYVRMLSELLEGLKDVRLSPVPGLALEAVLLSLCHEEGAKHIASSVAAKVQRRDAPKAPEKQEDAPARKKEDVHAVAKKVTKGTLEAPELTLGNVQSRWQDILGSITLPSVKMSLKNGTIARVEKDKVFLSFSSAFHRDKAGTVEASRMIEDTMKNIFKRSVRVECVLEEHTDNAEAEEDTNLAEAAAEVFGSSL